MARPRNWYQTNERFLRALGLDPEKDFIVSIDISLGADKLPTVTIKREITDELEVDALVSVIEQHELVPLEV